MHTFQIRKNDWTSLTGTLTVRLYALGQTATANGSGDVLVLVSGSAGLWRATVAEDLDGIYYYAVYLDAFPIFDGTIQVSSADEVWDVDAVIAGGTSTVSVSVLPGFVLNQRRNTANAIDLYVGEHGVVSVPVVDANKAPLDLRSKSVEFRFANKAGTLVATIAANSTVIGTLTFTATVPLTVNAISEGVFSIRDTSDASLIAMGVFNVRQAP